MQLTAGNVISVLAFFMAVVSFVVNYLHTERRFRAQSYPVIAPGLHIKPLKERWCVLGLSPLRGKNRDRLEGFSQGRR